MMDGRALIIFAKLPRPGEVKTRLGEAIGMERAAEFYRKCASNAFDIGCRLAEEGATVTLFYEPAADEQEIRAWVGCPFEFMRQEGDTLGERMHNAFKTTFLGGAKQSVIIGTDIPDLQVVQVRQAFEMLAGHDVVLGPAIDGGYYLLGMNSPLRDVFAGIRWSTQSVLAETIVRLKSLGLSYTLLTPLSDVDTVEDYRAYHSRIE